MSNRNFTATEEAYINGAINREQFLEIARENPDIPLETEEDLERELDQHGDIR